MRNLVQTSAIVCTLLPMMSKAAPASAQVSPTLYPLYDVNAVSTTAVPGLTSAQIKGAYGFNELENQSLEGIAG
jgi:hypothetical protein